MMVSPFAAMPSAARSEPAPLSAVLSPCRSWPNWARLHRGRPGTSSPPARAARCASTGKRRRVPRPGCGGSHCRKKWTDRQSKDRRNQDRRNKHGRQSWRAAWSWWKSPGKARYRRMARQRLAALFDHRSTICFNSSHNPTTDREGMLGGNTRRVARESESHGAPIRTPPSGCAQPYTRPKSLSRYKVLHVICRVLRSVLRAC